ncbi:MAG: hypothetical protein KF789_04540 [Bdellovibrionaceae bacterium]|nr:hypothetical protein [Pseudobdellovibrionaceae bacterium]
MAGDQIPVWLEGFVDSGDLKRIEEAVVRAESKTAAEIVPLIVRRSSAIGHLPLMIFSLLSFLTLVLLWPFHDLVDAAYGDYWLPLLLLGWLAVAFPLAKLHHVQRWLIPDVDEDFQARRRAWAEFAANRVASKKDRKGVLLFVSMMERKAVFLVDEGLLALWSPTDLEHFAADFGRRLHELPWGQAFEETIEELAEKLEKALPREAGSRDELGNRLQMKE